MNSGLALSIATGRHPVLESSDARGEFVPNDLRPIPIAPTPAHHRANMAGKSTYLRQVALIVIMAQMGRFRARDRSGVGVGRPRAYPNSVRATICAAASPLSWFEMRETSPC